MQIPKYLLFLLATVLLQCSGTTENKKSINAEFANNKINGVSFVAPPKAIGIYEVNQPKEIIKANYLSIMPYAFIPENSTELKYNSEWQWWGEKSEGTIETIRLAKEAGYKIMLKPHVWKRHGEFTGNHEYSEGKEWKEFEEKYEGYILNYAKIADSLDVSIFCLGTEWEKFVLSRRTFWKQLIKKIRNVYKGKLTYAANWDEYERIYFWEDLDFIGIDAYFPLVETVTPSVEEIKGALNKYELTLRALSDSTNTQILFTEYGYRSRDKTAFKPWEADRVGEANMLAQQNAYDGFYQVFWSKNYIAGGFIWKWFTNYKEAGGKQHNGFTPQNKTVEKVILKVYSESN